MTRPGKCEGMGRARRTPVPQAPGDRPSAPGRRASSTGERVERRNPGRWAQKKLAYRRTPHAPNHRRAASDAGLTGGARCCSFGKLAGGLRPRPITSAACDPSNKDLSMSAASTSFRRIKPSPRAPRSRYSAPRGGPQTRPGIAPTSPPSGRSQPDPPLPRSPPAPRPFVYETSMIRNTRRNLAPPTDSCTHALGQASTAKREKAKRRRSTACNVASGAGVSEEKIKKKTHGRPAKRSARNGLCSWRNASPRAASPHEDATHARLGCRAQKRAGTGIIVGTVSVVCSAGRPVTCTRITAVPLSPVSRHVCLVAERLSTALLSVVPSAFGLLTRDIAVSGHCLPSPAPCAFFSHALRCPTSVLDVLLRPSSACIFPNLPSDFPTQEQTRNSSQKPDEFFCCHVDNPTAAIIRAPGDSRRWSPRSTLSSSKAEIPGRGRGTCLCLPSSISPFQSLLNLGCPCRCPQAKRNLQATSGDASSPAQPTEIPSPRRARRRPRRHAEVREKLVMSKCQQDSSSLLRWRPVAVHSSSCLAIALAHAMAWRGTSTTMRPGAVRRRRIPGGRRVGGWILLAVGLHCSFCRRSRQARRCFLA